MNIKMEGHTE